MIEVRHLELLREFAERGSVTAVATATGRTPSAVSQQLRAAERAAGVPLLVPVGRGLSLTEAGRRLAAGGVEVATTLEKVRGDWDDYRGSVSGPVSLAAFPSAATALVPGILEDAEARGIRVRLADIDPAEDAFAALATNHDLVLAHSTSGAPPTGTDDLVVVPLGREPLDTALPATHPLAREPEVRPDQVAGLDWIGVPEGYPFDALLRSVGQAAGVTPRVAQRVRDNRLIEALVAASSGRTDGGCAAILPRWTTVPQNGVALVPLVGVPAVRDVFAVMRPEKAQRRAVQKVLRLLAAQVPKDQ